MSDCASMLIHVGFPKTGSTWLQQDLFANASGGFWSPWTLEVKEQYLLSNPYRFSAERARQVFTPGCNEAERRGLVAVISDEWLIGNQMSGDYRGNQIAEQLHATFPAAAVLIVIREQESMLLSSYREFVQVGGGQTLEEFIGAASALPGFVPQCRLDHLEYDLPITHYHALFGAARVLVEPFERMVADPPAFHARLTELTGARGTYQHPQQARNVGLRGATLTTRRALNNLVHPFGLNFTRGARRRAYIARSAELVGRVLPATVHARREADLRRRLHAHVDGYYAASNQRTGNLLDIDLAAFGYSC